MAQLSVMHLYRGTGKTPEIGMGGTVLMYSDTYPVTIIAVHEKQVAVQEDKAIVTGGTWPDLTYRYEPNPDGDVERYSLRKNGSWVRAGEALNGCRLMIGPRQKYIDPSF